MSKVWVDINEVITNSGELDSRLRGLNNIMRSIPNHDKYEPKKRKRKRRNKKK